MKHLKKFKSHWKNKLWDLTDQCWFINGNKLFTIDVDLFEDDEEANDFKVAKDGNEGDSEWLIIDTDKVQSGKKYTYIEHSGPIEDSLIKLDNKKKFK